MPPKTHVAALGSTNSERLTARPVRRGFVIVSACTELIGTGISAVRIERGRPKWPVTMLTDTYGQTNKLQIKLKSTLHASHDPSWRGFSFLGKAKKSSQRRQLLCLAPRRVHFARLWTQQFKLALTAREGTCRSASGASFLTKHPSPARDVLLLCVVV